MQHKPFVLTCGATFEAAQGDALPARISGVAYSGGPVMGGMAVIDLASTKLALPAPLLAGHEHDEVIGSLTQANNTGAELSISGEIYSDIDETARSIAAKAKRGHPWQLSVGIFGMNFEDVAPGNAVTVNGREFKGPITVLRGGTVREVSVVALGSDDNTNAAFFSARGADNFGANPMTIEQLQAQVATLTAQVAELTAERDRLKGDVQARDAQVAELSAAADTARKEARTGEVRALFSEIGQEFSEEAAKPYLGLDAATFSAISAQLKARAPQLPAHLRQQAAGGQPPAAGGSSVLLSVVKTAHGVN